MENKSVFVFGASGHAKVVIDIIEQQACYAIACILDDNPLLKGSSFMGYPVWGGKELFADPTATIPGKGIIAIGINETRCQLSNWVQQRGYELISVIHPSVQVARGVIIGNGSAVMALATINSDTVVGDNVIINTGATVDHDCILQDCVHVAPGSILCGSVRVGRKTFLGAGTTVIQDVEIGHNVMVGAGTTIFTNVESCTKMVGPRGIND